MLVLRTISDMLFPSRRSRLPDTTPSTTTYTDATHTAQSKISLPAMANISLESLGYTAQQTTKKSAPVAASTSYPAATKSTGQRGSTTSTEERALQLLGLGIPPEATANALGVSVSRISQLLSEENFAQKVSTLRFNNLQKHSIRDNKYDELEDKLLEKLETSMPFMLKPNQILHAIRTVNMAKRRGQAATEQHVATKNVVNLVLPKTIVEKFTVNVNNQVIRAGKQGLHTMQASDLLRTVERSMGTQEAPAPTEKTGTTIDHTE